MKKWTTDDSMRSKMFLIYSIQLKLMQLSNQDLALLNYQLDSKLSERGDK